MGKEEEKIAGLPNRPRVCSPQHVCNRLTARFINPLPTKMGKWERGGNMIQKTINAPTSMAAPAWKIANSEKDAVKLVAAKVAGNSKQTSRLMRSLSTRFADDAFLKLPADQNTRQKAFAAVDNAIKILGQAEALLDLPGRNEIIEKMVIFNRTVASAQVLGTGC